MAASFLLGLKFVARSNDSIDSRSTIRQRFIVYPVLAWILAVAVLFGLCFTPMVLGQDNGDGTNGYFEALFFAVLSSVVYSGFVLMLIFLNSLLPPQLLRVLPNRIVNDTSGMDH